MRLLDIMTAPWAIRPEKLTEIKALYHSHLRGEKIDWKALEARVGLSVNGEDEQPYQIVNGVAVIPVKGVLSKESSFFSWLFGGTSMRGISAAITQAIDNPSVSSILLDIDSPGGSVDGTEEIAEMIYQARGRKPITAYTDGDTCSAAYWIGSAADKIYISGDTVFVGSIGVVVTHVDQSEHDRQLGAQFTEITAGRYKRVVSAHRPLSEEGKGYLQSQVDYIYSVFVDTVARNRGIPVEDALKIADGRLYIGKQAIEAGLVDGVSTFDGLIETLAAGAVAGNYYAQEAEMNIDELKTKHPDIFQAVYDEGRIAGEAAGKAEVSDTVKTEAFTAGAQAERQRILDVRAQLIPGHEAIIEDAIQDGKTTGPEAAVKVLQAEKSVRVSQLAAFKADGPQEVPNAAAKEVVVGKQAAKDQTDAGDKLDKIAQEIKTRDKVSYADAMNQALKENPELARIYNGKEE